jgi:hypothetical protein
VRVTFWGTRGSLAKPAREQRRLLRDLADLVEEELARR